MAEPITTIAAGIAAANNLSSLIANALNFVNKGKNLELHETIMSAREEAMTLKEQLLNLKEETLDLHEEIAALKEKRRFDSELKWLGTVYSYNDKDTTVYVCPTCYDKDDIIMRLTQRDTTSGLCGTCGSCRRTYEIIREGAPVNQNYDKRGGSWQSN